MKPFRTLLALVPLALAAPAAAQTTLDFTTVELPAAGGFDIGKFRLDYDGIEAGFVAWDPILAPSTAIHYTGRRAIFANDLFGTTTLRTIYGRPFDMHAISMANLAGSTRGRAEARISFLGTRIDGSTVSQTFVIPGFVGTPTLATYNFSSDFTGLATVSWTNDAFRNSAQFDRIEASTVTPEPVSMALLGTGLAGLGAVRRRRRKRAE